MAILWQLRRSEIPPCMCLYMYVCMYKLCACMRHTMDNLLLRQNYDIVKGEGGVVLEQKPHLSIILLTETHMYVSLVG